MIVFIKPLASDTPQQVRQEIRIRNARNRKEVGVRTMTRSKAGTSTDVFSYKVSPAQKMLVTGLLELESNEGFIKGKKPQEVRKEYGLDDSWAEPLKELVKSDIISKQHRLEIQAGVPYDMYTPRLPDDWTPFYKGALPYLARLRVRLSDEVNRIDTSTPEGELKLDLLLHCGYVAPDLNSANPAVHRYYVSSKIQEEAAKVSLIERKAMAQASIMEMNRKNKLKDLGMLLAAIDNGHYLGGYDSQAIYRAAMTFVDHSVRNADAFNAMYNTMNNEPDRVLALALANRGIAAGVIRNRSGSFVVPAFEDHEFPSKQSLVEHLIKFDGPGTLREYLIEKVAIK